ncbi:cytochrome P450 20A1-like isoform X2 [Acipenser ruthenus]|uniref:cytochrome P450 20A1-like isoform X2 n=1 Tax=Acipenser ruthenus TaxID=7906 RepID=UPI0027405E5F|nr:cytochrome P450 20A1-like isoform X2 [Acipenser ruthenus]
MLDFVIFAVTFLIVLVSAVLYLYPASRQASGIPGITPTDEKDGNLPDIVNKGSLHEFLVNLHERYGSAASFWFGGRLVVSLGSMDLLKQHINPNRTSDTFEMMLKSLLGYQSGLSGDAAESHMRKKLYETGVSKAIESNFSLTLKLADELLSKWESYPASQHVPLCQHLLGLAMKSATQTAMGSRFEDDQEVIQFRKNHDAIWSEIGKGFLDGSLEKSSTRKKHYEDALTEMESVLKKVAKERRGKSFSQHAFIDTLLQGNLSEKQHISTLARTCRFFLSNIRRIRPFLTNYATQLLVQALVLSRLDYCNSLLAGLPASATRPLQLIQNSAARLVFSLPRFAHATPLLRSLHWLPITARIQFKTLVLAYRCLDQTAPSYLQTLISPYTPTRPLRSACTRRLALPPLRSPASRARSFSTLAPQWWNDLPTDVRTAQSLTTFRRLLKTHLFKQHL